MASALARPSEWLGPRFRKVVPLLALAAILALAVLTPFLLPYWRVSREQGLTRSLAEVALYSARWTDYLATGGRLHFELWSHHFFDREGLFAGVVGAFLTLVALGTGVAWRDRRARMAVAFGLVAFAMSFGPAFPLYGLVGRLFPIMAGIRGASRFGQLYLAAVAILAGFGLARLTTRYPRRSLALGLTLLLGAHVEALRAPIQLSAFRWDLADVRRTEDGRRQRARRLFPVSWSARSFSERRLHAGIDEVLEAARERVLGFHT